jgi:hypothetical protein
MVSSDIFLVAVISTKQRHSAVSDKEREHHYVKMIWTGLREHRIVA